MECNDVPFGIVATLSKAQNRKITCIYQQADPKVKQIIAYQETRSEDKEARETQDNFTLKEGVYRQDFQTIIAPTSFRQILIKLIVECLVVIFVRQRFIVS